MLARLTKIKNNDKNNGNSGLLAEDKNNIIRKKIHSLYRRAVAKEVREETNLKQIEQEKYHFEREKNFQLKLELVGATLASFIVALVTAFYPITRIDVLDRLLPLFIGTIPPTLAISWQIRQSIINENDTEKEASIRCVLKSGSFSLLLLPKPKGI
jgi:hypothetical protein